MKQDIEEWRVVTGYPNYSVSSFGRIKRTKGIGCKKERVLRCTRDRGYVKVILPNKSSLYLHTLVATEFIGKRPDGFDVNHIDGNKANNHYTNLEYVTRGDNNRHAKKLGLNRNLGESHYNSKLSFEKVMQIRSSNSSSQALAVIYGVSPRTVRDVRNCATWRSVK